MIISIATSNFTLPFYHRCMIRIVPVDYLMNYLMIYLFPLTRGGTRTTRRLMSPLLWTNRACVSALLTSRSPSI